MMTAGRPRALLWDVGNVIVRWDPRTLYSKIFQEPVARDRFLSSVCTMDWHGATDRGVSFADNIDRLTVQHPHYAAEIAAWWDRWPEMFSGPIGETEATMDALAARGVPQHGLTNMSTETWPMVQAMSPAFRHLGEVVVSGVERVMKPEPRIYQLVLERTGLAASDLLFVDDSAANIAAAAALGFHVHHFVDPAALRPAIAAHGLL
ncbi:MAG: HAD-superfamily hydrolase, subfamily variant 3 [Caulobacter sp.]|nr:HAD-superfamily hydrolase, subfamily variant 3 [Caulobacter sp.]